MSSGMKIIRFIFVVALGAAVGLTIKECGESGGIDWQNAPTQTHQTAR